MVRTFLQLLFAVFVSIAAYFVLTIALGIPPTSKRLKASNKKQSPDLNVVLRPVFSFVGNFLYMEPNKEAAQAETLQRAGINLTPREFLARTILGAVFGLLFCIWGTLMNSKLFMIAGVVLAVALAGKSADEANDRLKEKDAEVKKELPKFVSTIIVSMRTEKNIIKVIESYAKEAKPALKSDLEVLISQMSTGNIETALRNFDVRMGAQEVSSLVTSLIYIENGIDQTVALQYLEQDMRQAQAMLRRAELEKLPGKMRKTFVPCGIVIIVIFFYTIFTQIISNFTLFL